MVHTVKIKAYTPRADAPGTLTFVLDGKTFNARCYADANLADGLLVIGTEYPVTLTVEAAGAVDYSSDPHAALEVVEARGGGDLVRVNGRTWDSVSHDLIHLESVPSVGLKLNLPQTATDYRGGTWLSATGLLCADLPPEEHD